MLTVEGLHKTYGRPRRRGARGDAPAVEDVGFTVGRGEMVTLLGPSGCGKTTTLRCIAGLESPDSGRIAVDGVALFDGDRGVAVPANRRQFGMVFQSYAIWPHLTVFENAAFPLRVGPGSRSRPTRAELTERVQGSLDAVGLGAFGSRRATDLSGGQQQRLALARAMVMRPRLLLLDEPLSNLDAKLRERMRFELKQIQRTLGVTSLYVTHDQAEALSMSDRVVIMRDGRIIQVGTPKEVYDAPATAFVAEFLGNANTTAGRVVARTPEGSVRVATEFGELTAGCLAGYEPAVDDRVTVCVRPESVELRPRNGHAATGVNTFSGRLSGRAFLGESTEVLLTVGTTLLRARRPVDALADDLSDVVVHLPASRCLIVPTS